MGRGLRTLVFIVVAGLVTVAVPATLVEAHSQPARAATKTPSSAAPAASTDAYAGTFLYAAWAAWNTGHDTAALTALRPGITGAIRAIESTLDTDGLTWATPTYHVKYLMDEAEVYVGLRSAAALTSALTDKATVSRMTLEAKR